MDHRVDGPEQLGNPVGRDEPREDERVPDAQPLEVGDQPIAKDAVADPDEPDPGLAVRTSGATARMSSCPLSSKSRATVAKATSSSAKPELAADLRARARRVQKRVGVHAAVDRRELIGPADSGGQGLLGHGVANADDRVAAPGRPPLQRDVEPVPQRRLEGPNGMPWIVCTTAGTRSSQAAARPRMPAFELCVWTTSGLSRRKAERSFR